MKIYSICENHLFAKAYANGKKAVEKRIVLYLLPDKNAYLLKKQNPLKNKLNRVGITASKKIGGAVQRNRVKRIIREAFMRLEREENVKKGYLVVIASRLSAVYAKTDDIYSELLDAALKVGLVVREN
jgi:ribonuclease P protein component